jgi:hypothetical protein
MFGNDGNENEKPGIQEQYETAGNTSDLTVEADRRGAGDVIVGAGFVTHVEGAPAWSATRTGMALLRLHSEWNAVAKPRRADKQALDAFAARIKGDDERARATAEGKGEKYAQPKSSAAERAATEAQRWYANELRLMANSLKSRAVVWEQIGQWIAIKGIRPGDCRGGPSALAQPDLRRMRRPRAAQGAEPARPIRAAVPQVLRHGPCAAPAWLGKAAFLDGRLRAEGETILETAAAAGRVKMQYAVKDLDGELLNAAVAKAEGLPTASGARSVCRRHED